MQREGRAAGHDQDDRCRQDRSGAPPGRTDRTGGKRSAAVRLSAFRQDAPSPADSPSYRRWSAEPESVSLQTSAVAVADPGGIRPCVHGTYLPSSAISARLAAAFSAPPPRWREAKIGAARSRCASPSRPFLRGPCPLPARRPRPRPDLLDSAAGDGVRERLALRLRRPRALARQVVSRLLGSLRLAWIAVAWHGAHFHRPPRPAALLMNLEEILETPLPAWSEMPWPALAGFLGLGWRAHKLSPPRAALRLATAAAGMVFIVVHGVALLRYRTADMLRFSQFDDLVRTQGLEGAVVLDGLELLRGPDSAAYPARPAPGRGRASPRAASARPPPRGPRARGPAREHRSGIGRGGDDAGTLPALGWRHAWRAGPAADLGLRKLRGGFPAPHRAAAAGPRSRLQARLGRRRGRPARLRGRARFRVPRVSRKRATLLESRSLPRRAGSDVSFRRVDPGGRVLPLGTGRRRSLPVRRRQRPQGRAGRCTS